MGVLKHEASGRRVALGTRVIAGRAQECAVRLGSSAASGEHAVLFWDGARWSARDLGSRNGTRVGGKSLAVGERVFLDAGAILTFGGDAEQWMLEDAGPPVASARAEPSGEVRCAERGLLVLPSALDPRVTISQDCDGGWRIEIDGASRPAVDLERIDTGGLWTLHIPARGEVPATGSMDGEHAIMATTRLRFEVSRDEEFVTLSLVQGASVTSLGARAHHELLLALARARLRDVGSGAPPSEQGWLYVDDLLSMLRLDLHHFNVNVFRARQQLAGAGMLDAGSIVERRSTTRQIRLGTAAVEVLKP